MDKFGLGFEVKVVGVFMGAEGGVFPERDEDGKRTGEFAKWRRLEFGILGATLRVKMPLEQMAIVEPQLVVGDQYEVTGSQGGGTAQTQELKKITSIKRVDGTFIRLKQEDPGQASANVPSPGPMPAARAAAPRASAPQQ